MWESEFEVCVLKIVTDKKKNSKDYITNYETDLLVH